VEREGGAVAGAVDGDQAAHQRGHDVVADRQPQPAAALAQLGGEERVENARHVFRRDAAAVVAEADLHAAVDWGVGAQPHAAAAFAGKRVQQGVVDEVGNHLAVRAGIAVHHHGVRHLDFDAVAGGADAVHHGGDHLVRHLRQVECAPLLGGAVHRHLLEAVDQVGRAGQPAHHQLVRLARVVQIAGQRRALQAGAIHLRFQFLGFLQQRAGDQQAVADRRVQLVRDAGHQRTQRRQLFLRHQLRLRVLQLAVGFGVVERDGAIGAQRTEDQPFAFAVRLRLAALHRHHAQRAFADQQRH
ncbi:conserved hypothetical protein, partial [Ricinus communis]